VPPRAFTRRLRGFKFFFYSYLFLRLTSPLFAQDAKPGVFKTAERVTTGETPLAISDLKYVVVCWPERGGLLSVRLGIMEHRSIDVGIPGVP